LFTGHLKKAFVNPPDKIVETGKMQMLVHCLFALASCYIAFAWFFFCLAKGVLYSIFETT
jgi:hypothetical protein